MPLVVKTPAPVSVRTDAGVACLSRELNLTTLKSTLVKLLTRCCRHGIVSAVNRSARSIALSTSLGYFSAITNIWG